MTYTIEVKRIRHSTTQGSVEVWVNDKLAERYGDRIELIDGEYKSTEPDSVFINAALRALKF